MYSIYKYELPISNQAAVKMPQGAKILQIAEQHGAAFIWAMVDLMAPTESRLFHVVGTGHELGAIFADTTRHIATFHMNDSNYIFHVFE